MYLSIIATPIDIIRARCMAYNTTHYSDNSHLEVSTAILFLFCFLALQGHVSGCVAFTLFLGLFRGFDFGSLPPPFSFHKNFPATVRPAPSLQKLWRAQKALRVVLVASFARSACKHNATSFRPPSTCHAPTSRFPGKPRRPNTRKARIAKSTCA